MKRVATLGRSNGLRAGALLLTLMAVSFGALYLLMTGVDPLVSSGPEPHRGVTTLLALTDQVFAGIFLAIAALLAYLIWRVTPVPRIGWLVAASVLVSLQSLSLSVLTVYDTAHVVTYVGWEMHVVAFTTVTAVVLSLGGLRRGTGALPDPLVVGLGLGLLAAGGVLLSPPLSVTSLGTPTWLLIGTIVLANLALLFSIFLNTALSRPCAALLGMTVIAIGASNLIVPAGLSGTAWDVLVSLARGAAGVTWMLAASGSLRRASEHEQQRVADLENSLLATVGSDRDNRERLHELRSTLAGLINASGLLERKDIHGDVRLRLEVTIRRELARMQRLITDEKDLPTIIDLDEALDGILEVHRLKGRRIDFQRSGTTAQGRYDALAEVVGILVDNAATHGGSDDSVVAVTCRDDDTVEISVTDHGCGIPAHERERIFAWGERGDDSPGQGIGLNLAQRLVAEDGGSLTCSEPAGGGSAFVISLPAARLSFENDHVSTRSQSG